MVGLNSPISKSLRVGIDAHAIGSNLGGNETYIRGVLESLRAHPQHCYFVYVNDPGAVAEVQKLCPNAESRVLGHVGALARLGYKLAWLAKSDRVDVLHTQYVAPLFSPPMVVMIHDLSFRHHPEWYTAAERFRFERTIPWTARRAHRVVTVSEFSQRDIVRNLGINEKKVSVTYNRINDRFVPAASSQIEEVLRRFEIGQPYILAVGNLQPRKNLPRLIAAWERLREQHPELRPRLVIVGKKAWLFEETMKVAATSRFAADIIFTGYVPDEQLPALYSGAILFIYPSLFEGFGLPPLEAMGCGTPVVVSNTTALPEVCGDAAEYVDPLSIESITEGMRQLCSLPALREERSAGGLEQVKKFRTNDLGTLTVRAYEEAACAPN